jgi:hypothetical protein
MCKAGWLPNGTRAFRLLGRIPLDDEGVVMKASYPSHFLPNFRHRKHCGFVSSHFTLLVLCFGQPKIDYLSLNTGSAAQKGSNLQIVRLQRCHLHPRNDIEPHLLARLTPSSRLGLRGPHSFTLRTTHPYRSVRPHQYPISDQFPINLLAQVERSDKIVR